MTTDTKSWHQNAQFETGSHEDWHQSAVQLLAGKDFKQTLASLTLDDIEVQPLYPQHKEAPFKGRDSSHWSTQQSYCRGNIDQINQQILSDLNGGVNAIELSLATAENSDGIPCLNIESLEQLLFGVHADMIELSLNPGSENRTTGALLLAYFYRQKIAPADVKFALNIDPLKTQAQTGFCAGSAMQSLEQFASYCSTQYPNATSICIDSSAYHNAGCTEAQELAYLLSTTVDYLRCIQSLDVATAASQLKYRLALDNDFFINVAKLRAARVLINQIFQHCGAEQHNHTTTIETVIGVRALSTLDNSVNILRASTQVAAAMTGGANGINCLAYDHLTGNSEKARRLARNTHHILIEESGLLNVNDPARGSGYVEEITNQLCDSAWELFQKIESAGGMHQALTTGLIASQVLQSCNERTQAMTQGKTRMVGVTEFPNPQESPKWEESVADQNCITTIASVKDNSTSTVSVTALVSALSNGESTTDYQHSTSNASDPLPNYRDAAQFEALRLRTHQFNQANQINAEVTLLAMGNRRDYAARSGFCKTFFAIAGLKTSVIELQDDSDIEQVRSKCSNLTVLCSSDTKYMENAEKIANLKNLEHLWIAGNNPDVLAALSNSVTEQIHLSCDKLSVLKKALNILGVPATGVQS